MRRLLTILVCLFVLGAPVAAEASGGNDCRASERCCPASERCCRASDPC